MNKASGSDGIPAELFQILRMEEPGRLQSMGSLSRAWLSDFTFPFHFHALEKEMATHSSVLAWRIPGMGEPGELLSVGSHRVRHDWSNSAAAADAVKVLYSIRQQIWKTQQWPQDWKWSVFTPIPKKGNVKECSNNCTIALISHASEVMLKILQARL